MIMQRLSCTRRVFLLMLPFLLTGCIMIPGPYEPYTEAGTFPKAVVRPEIHGIVGNAKSTRPLRVGVSTVKDVQAYLGIPYDSHGNAVVYCEFMESGCWCILVSPMPLYGDLWRRTDYLVLRFDERSVLSHYKLIHGDSHWTFLETPFGGHGQDAPPDWVFQK